MSNHSSGYPEEASTPLLRELIRSAQEDKLGATNIFPGGKLDASDEGELKFAIAADSSVQKVLFNFGKPVVWFGLTKAQALELADTLRLRANELPWEKNDESS